MSFIRDAAGLTGMGLVLFGIYQVYAPLTYVVGGLWLIAMVAVWSLKVSKQ